MNSYQDITKKVCDTLVKAGSTFRQDKKASYSEAIASEINPQAKWVMENILENAQIAEKTCGPLCDDTGIPHLFLEIGKKKAVSGEMLSAIYEGVREGLRKLPGRPMAVMGNDCQRIDQSGGLDPDSAALSPSPVLLKMVDEDVLRLTVLMQGGGPEIRSKTYRVFHKHDVKNVTDEIVSWASEVVGQLGCTPCTLAVGIGRSHFEASSMMLEAMVKGRYDAQNDIERDITARVNETAVGPLGLGGNKTVLATFLKVGPQRASGVRIVCMRPCCCFEPRIAQVEL